MKKPGRDQPSGEATLIQQEVDLDAETDVLGDQGSSSGSEDGLSSDGIPDHFFGVVDSPNFQEPSEARMFISTVVFISLSVIIHDNT